MCFSSIVGYEQAIEQAPLFNLYKKLPCKMLMWDCAIIGFIC